MSVITDYWVTAELRTWEESSALSEALATIKRLWVSISTREVEGKIFQTEIAQENAVEWGGTVSASFSKNGLISKTGLD